MVTLGIGLNGGVLCSKGNSALLFMFVSGGDPGEKKVKTKNNLCSILPPMVKIQVQKKSPCMNPRVTKERKSWRKSAVAVFIRKSNNCGISDTFSRSDFKSVESIPSITSMAFDRGSISLSDNNFYLITCGKYVTHKFVVNYYKKRLQWRLTIVLKS